MIDFKKRLNKSNSSKKLNPIEIYSTLDRSADKGPLRAVQTKILSDWFNNRRADKDVVIKLHTGQGKTLIGLLILQSYLNSGDSPVMYVCPDRYLVDQTCDQATQFGIEYLTIDNDGEIPIDFYDSKAILIVHAQKVFNGLSKFGVGNKSLDVGAIVLDDSHACISTIEESAIINIKSNTKLYKTFVAIFEDYLKEQGLAVFKEIINGDSRDVMVVPFWAWYEKYEIVVESLIENLDEVSKFSWHLIKDDLKECRCFVSSNAIEIIPYKTPIYKYKFFDSANHRILMSATTNNDASFIKGLGISKESVRSPLIDVDNKWSGEKMVLVPFYFDPDLDRSAIVSWLAKEVPSRKYGVVALTPSNRAAKYWESCGAEVANSDNIFNLVEKLKTGSTNMTIAFSNRYDGIDLPDRSCRILILDERPFSQTLFDQYQEGVRSNSDLVNIKIAQKIEQGLGRGVRGEKDYCIILLNGTRLLAAIKDRKLRNFFSPQTRKQVEIGLELTEFAMQDAEIKDSLKILKDVMNQCLKRDEGWKEYYSEQMDKIELEGKNDNLLDILELEARAEQLYIYGEYSKAKDEYQKIVDDYIEDNMEKGWYLQEMARVIYQSDRDISNSLQGNAHKVNHYLLKPPSGLDFIKLGMKEERSTTIRKWITSFDDYTSLKIQLDNILSGLVFGPKYREFERSLHSLGEILGFGSEQPELEWKEGPDNLWCLDSNRYLIIECKSAVETNRKKIHKKEAEQLLHSIEWFKKNYQGCSGVPLLIIPTRQMDKGVHLSQQTKILRRGVLNSLKKRVSDFFASFKKSDLNSISISQINNGLNNFKLTPKSIIDELESPYYLR